MLTSLITASLQKSVSVNVNALIESLNQVKTDPNSGKLCRVSTPIPGDSGDGDTGLSWAVTSPDEENIADQVTLLP